MLIEKEYKMPKWKKIYAVVAYPLGAFVIYHDLDAGRPGWSVIISLLLGASIGMDMADHRAK